MGINLRRADNGVAEESLDHPQIGVILQHMSRRGMPEGVRVYVLGDAGQVNPLINRAGYTIDSPEPKKNYRYSKHFDINVSTVSPMRPPVTH
jgi:hypothetical protein